MYEITLDGPGKNALGTGMMDFLLGELQKANGQPVLLTGRGDGFSAGLNLKEVAALDRAGMDGFLRLLERLMRTLYLYPGPVVAAVNGHAIAGGCILALCCDYRVGASNPALKIGLNEVALGLHFPPGILRICRNRLPLQHQETVLLGAGLFGPEQALQLGLLDELAADPVAAARARLQAFAAHPAHAWAATKKAIREAAVEVPKAEEDAFFTHAVAFWSSDELKAKLAAVLKR